VIFLFFPIEKEYEYNPLLLPWPLCPVLPLNLICTSLIIPWLLSKVTLTYTGSLRSMYRITCPLSIALVVLKYQSSPRHMYPFRNKACFYGEKILALRLTPKLEDYPLSAVRDCFSVFAGIHTE